MLRNIRYSVLIAISLLSSTAFAQERTYTLTVTGAEIAVIGEALGKEPFKSVNALVTKLNAQILEQDKPKPPPEAPKPPETPDGAAK